MVIETSPLKRAIVMMLSQSTNQYKINMFNTAITFLADGALLGLTYFPKGDRAPEFEDEDWSELNIYFLVIRITFRWW